jgi:hypothetical protein
MYHRERKKNFKEDYCAADALSEGEDARRPELQNEQDTLEGIGTTTFF